MIRLSTQLFCILIGLYMGVTLPLCAATAQDIQGEWIIDGAETWEGMKKSAQFASMPPEKLSAIEPMMKAQLSAMTCTVTPDKIISTGRPQAETESYRVLSIDGDMVKTESTNAQGKIEKTNVLVTGDKLILSYPDQEGKILVLQRKPQK